MRTPLRLASAGLTAAAVTAALAVALAGCGSSANSGPPATSTSPATTGSSAAASSPAASSPAASSPAAAEFPLTVTAANGKVTIKRQPMRIVSLDPTSTEDLYAVGAGKQVVAVDQDSNYPAGAPKTSLSGLTPNIEAISKYNPSLVVSSQDSGGLVSGLAKLGVPVLIEPAPATLAGVYSQIQQIGQATGHAAQAQRLTKSMEEQISATVGQAGASHGRMTYYWELSANPYYSATSATFIGRLVALFGLKNIADAASKSADGGYPELTQEYIVTAKPQLIFLADNQPADGGQTPAVVARRPGWAGIPAVRNGDVIALNDDIASRWGPRLPQLVAEIAAGVERAGAAASGHG